MTIKNRTPGKNVQGYKVSVLGNKCYRCNHSWVPRNIDKKPIACPKCKNPYWDRPKKSR